MSPSPRPRVPVTLLLLGAGILLSSLLHEQHYAPRPGQGTVLPLEWQLFLPLIQKGGDAETPPPTTSPPSTPSSTPATPAEREWDPRLTQRGALLLPATVTPGAGYWRLVRARWFDTAESAGRHHIFVDALNAEGTRQVGVPVQISWPASTPIPPILTGEKPNEAYAADFAMYAIAPSYRAQIADGAPADGVDGMGLGEVDDPARGHHTSYGLTWQWVIAPLAETPTITPTRTITNTPDVTATPPVSTAQP